MRAQIYLLVLIVWTASAMTSRESTRAEISDVVVESIRENPPQTPAQTLQVVETMLNVDRGDLAMEYLKPLAEGQLSDEQLGRLNQQLGAAYFLRLMREPAIDPVGDEFAIKVFEAANRVARNPQRVKNLVDRLVDANYNTATILIEQLQPAGSGATAELLTRLARIEPDNRDPRQRLITAIVLGGIDAVAVVEAGIDSGDELVATSAIEASRELLADHPRLRFAVLSRYLSPAQPRLQQAAQRLVNQYYGARVDRAQVSCWLAEEISRLLGLKQHADAIEEIWYWSPTRRVFANRSIPRQAAKYYRATRLAQQLFSYHPQHPDASKLYAVSAAGLAKWQSGLDSPLELGGEPAPGSGAREQIAFVNSMASDKTLLAALDCALRHNAAVASLGLMDLISRRPESLATMLSSPHGNPSPLVAALRHPNRRVRWAAAETIMVLDPQSPFKGACDLGSFYQTALTSRGARVVLVIDPNRRRAVTVAGNLGALGYTAVTARNGTEAMKVVVGEPDLHLIMLSAQTYEPRFTELLQELQHDYRSRSLPLAVLGEAPEPAAEAMLSRYANVTRFPDPLDFESTSVLTSRLEPLADAIDLAPHERGGRARTALNRLVQLSSRTGEAAFFDLASVPLASTDSVPLDANAIALWANLGTPAAQHQLISLAADSAADPERRIDAARGLERSLSRFGINLRMDQLSELLRQLDQRRQRSSNGQLNGPERLLLRVLEAASLEQANG